MEELGVGGGVGSQQTDRRKAEREEKEGQLGCLLLS